MTDETRLSIDQRLKRLEENREDMGIRENELELDRRVGSALRLLERRGVDVFKIESVGVGWEVYVENENGDDMISTISHHELVDALEYVARVWPR